MFSNKINNIKEILADFDRLKAKDTAIIQGFKDMSQKLDNKRIN